VQNVQNKVLPVSKIDAIALKHDVDYLIGSGDKIATYKADNYALKQADYSLQGALMKTGLIARSVFNLPFNRYKPNAQEVGLLVKQDVKQSPYYQRNFKRLGVDLVNW